MKKRRIVSLISIALAVSVTVSTVFAVVMPNNAEATEVEAKVKYHFLNVNSIERSTGGPIGSADCILIEDNVGSERIITMVDTGYNDTACWEKVVGYIKNLNITKIDNLFITHPHNDHHGGVPAICENFDITRCYYTLPKDWSKVRPIEMDWADLFVTYGIVGFLFSYLFVGSKLISMRSQRKMKECGTPYYWATLILLIYGTFAGHLFFEAISSTFFGIVLAGLYISSREKKLMRVSSNGRFTIV